MKRKMVRALAAAALLCAAGGQSVAQDAAAQSGGAQPAAQDDRDEDEDDPSKFFWFHGEGVAADTARADIEYCVAQTSTIQARRNPSSGAGGLIGALVEGVVHGIMEGVETRRMRDAGMRKCMGLYGYQRYQVPEPQWNAMMRADDAIERLTAYTSGPTPSTERLPR